MPNDGKNQIHFYHLNSILLHIHIRPKDFIFQKKLFLKCDYHCHGTDRNRKRTKKNYPEFKLNKSWRIILKMGTISAKAERENGQKSGR